MYCFIATFTGGVQEDNRSPQIEQVNDNILEFLQKENVLKVLCGNSFYAMESRMPCCACFLLDEDKTLL